MASIKGQVISGVFYTAISRYSAILISLIITGVLARILSPEDFGVVAISTVILSFFDLLCNMGFGPAIIQNKDLNESELSDIFSFTILIGILMGIIFFFFAKPISVYYNKEILFHICRILSLILIFISLNIVPNALLLKQKRFKFLSFTNLIVQFILGFVAITSAYLGLGIYSLLIVPFGTALIVFCVNFLNIDTKLSFKFNFKFDSIKKIISFSTYQFLFNIVNYFSRNLDKILVGKYIGMQSLGFYEKSYRLMMMPLSTITNVITPTIQPIFSEYQNQKEQLLGHSLKLVKTLALIGCILTPFLFFTAKELILIIFGNQWENAIPVFKILSLSVFVQLVDSSSGSILQSSNSIRYLFISGLICAFINILAILISVIFFNSIQIVAISIDIALFFNLIISIYYIYKKTFNTSVFEVLRMFIYPSIIGLIVGIVLYFLQLNTFPLLISLITKFIVTILISVFLIHKFKIYNIFDLILNFKNILK
jgi:PST family polysaccharide transporter